MDASEQLTLLEKRIADIEARNRRVEADKAWETSRFRKGTIFVLTYIAVVIFLSSVNIGRPWTGAIVPALGFLLSTMTFPLVKRWWVNKKTGTGNTI